MKNYYALDDTGQRKGVLLIPKEQATKYNADNYGIFWSINRFKDDIRRKEYIERINMWSVDIDSGEKVDMMKRIKKSPLHPSMIVETKNGYHLYWIAEDGSVANWEAIVGNRLVPFFNADKKARDLCRILRVPGYYHCKDPENKFLIEAVYFNKDLTYSEDEMLQFFKKKKETIKLFTKEQTKVSGESFWHKSSNIPCEWGLQKLSGSHAVGMEQITFSDHRNGTKQIVVNGKATSSWIDSDGKIGSYERGGPCIPNWINWYHNNWRKTADILKEFFNDLLS